MNKFFKTILLSFFLIAFCHTKTVSDLSIQSPKDKNGGQPVILFLGDSITTGFQLPKEKAFPEIVQQYFNKEKINFRSVNGGVSGNRTGDVLNRISFSLNKNVRTVFLEIGGNDVFFGEKIETIKKNMVTLIRIIKRNHSHAVLCKIDFPLNRFKLIDNNYIKKFNHIFNEVQKEENVDMVYLSLSKLTQHPQYWLEDGIHPNALGHTLIAKDIIRFLQAHKDLLRP